MPNPFRLISTITMQLAFLLAGMIPVTGCSPIEYATPAPKSARPDRTLTMDVPEILSGTISSDAVLLGYNDSNSQKYKPVIVSGYGLVVGLDGTGSRDIPPPLRAHMLAEASRGGIGNQHYGETAGSLSPEQLLNSPNAAVVIVQAIIPQGAAKGTQFDIRVFAVPGSGTTSLEGGLLYTTKLRPGPLTAGSAQATELAQAYGPIFVNPFAEPGAVGRDTVSRTAGRILNGGVVVKDMPLKLRLANPSHSRAAVLQTAINTRFPIEPGQRQPTARGESDLLIEITVPPSFQRHTDQFVDLLLHTTIRQANPEAAAMSVKRALLANPLVSNAATLRWEALGKRALPLIRDLYSDPEEVPRLAALRAGAYLNDALAIPHLVAMANNGDADAKIEAIRMLSEMSINPQVDLAIRNLLDDDDVEVRIEAYEALVTRRDPYMNRYDIDRKFVVDVVDSVRPMIYITQVGMPRIVVFGKDVAIERPLALSVWSNRLMLKGDLEQPLLEVYYRQPTSEQGLINRVDPSVTKFLQFLGHQTTIDKPAPGLNLSYGETVGAIYQVWNQKHIKADFRAEQDRILAAIRRQQSEEAGSERPEFIGEPGAAPPEAMGGGRQSDLGSLSPAASSTNNAAAVTGKQPDVAPRPD